MRLKRVYLTRTLQMGQYTLRSLDGAEGAHGTWSLALHNDLGAISVQLGPDRLYVPLVHVESFEVVPTTTNTPELGDTAPEEAWEAAKAFDETPEDETPEDEDEDIEDDIEDEDVEEPVEPLETLEAPVKRGPGRPRKNVEASEEAPKRGPGRPRKKRISAEL